MRLAPVFSIPSAIAFSNGWSTMKLYFMIGLPFETDEDVLGICTLAKKIEDIYKAFEHDLNNNFKDYYKESAEAKSESEGGLIFTVVNRTSVVAIHGKPGTSETFALKKGDIL